MTSITSDCESNVSGFINYSDKNFKHLYTSMIQNMELINQDLLQIEKNMKNIVQQAGPLESQLNVLLQTLPRPNITIPMETDLNHAIASEMARLWKGIKSSKG